MTTLRDVPGSVVLARLDEDTLAAVPVGALAEAAARRWANSRPADGDEAALRGWLASHPECEITSLPAPEEQPGQLAFIWEAA